MRTLHKPAFPRFLALAAFLAVFLLAACDAGTSATEEETLNPDELTELAAALTQDLNLSPDQAKAVDDLLATGQQRTPGHLWTVAAALQQRLRDEQKTRLSELAAQRRERLTEQGRRGRFDRGEQGNGRRFGQRRGAHEGLAAVLTPEQQEAFKALHLAHRDEVQKLRQARSEGTLTLEAFREQMQTLREAMRAEMAALLTDEQKATLEQRRQERKARGEAFKETAAQARAEALGLSAEQEAALEALQAEHQAAFQALMEQARAGELDREAARAQGQALREAHQADLAAVLTPAQQEIVEIHDALAARLGFGKRGRHGGFGGPHGPGGRTG